MKALVKERKRDLNRSFFKLLTMISLSKVLTILVVHFLADFCLQTHDQATMKSTSNKFLGYHVGTYSLIWFIASYGLLGDWWSAFWFAMTTFSLHFWTDYVTSRLTKHYFGKQDYHNGFVVVGFDQILHYLQLLLTYIWLS